MIRDNYRKLFKLSAVAVAAALAFLTGSGPGATLAQEVDPADVGALHGGAMPMQVLPVPQFWRIDESLERPNLSDRQPIRILTTDDHPPFGFRNRQNALTGFNTELAQSLCAALAVTCEITARDWDELLPALVNGNADAVIASMRITSDALKSVDFTKPYFRSPARFAVRSGNALERAEPRAMRNLRIGVRRGTAHEAFLSAFFTTSIIRLFDDRQELRAALRNGDVDAIFADGVELSFWILSRDAEDCCVLLDGAFAESHFFGAGAGIAVQQNDEQLRNAFNYALDRIKLSGIYDRIYRRYFPLALY